MIAIIPVLILVLSYLIITGSLTLTSQPVLVKNFVNLNDIKEITQYRSCQGHLVVPANANEPKSNMKHYFAQTQEYDYTDNKLKVYAPFDGYVTNIMIPTSDNEGEIWMGPLKFLPFGQWNFILSHVNVLPSIKAMDRVSAGQLIAYASFTRHPNAFDAIYARVRLPTLKIDDYESPYAELDSVFNHMANEVLAEYTSRGISKENLIIPVEMREKKPCAYGTKPYFKTSEKQKDEEWVELR